MPQTFDEDDQMWVPAATIAAPTAPGAAYVQAEAQSAVTAINSIIAALKAANIIAED
jgi:hypothetical protein